MNTFIAQHYVDTWQHVDHKITLGISVYGLQVSPREIQRTAITLKKQLRAHGVSLRVIPNNEPALNTATSHHNKLGLSDNKVELLVIRGSSGKIIIAESTGAQNITAIAARDQARPKTDAFVGMLPPKLALIMLNIASKDGTPSGVWDPFCGTGVVLQEARLLGLPAYGSDLSEKMVDYSRGNMSWLESDYRHTHAELPPVQVMQADAMTAQPPREWSIDTIVSESYLGQPFSAFPTPDKLEQVRGNCNHIISEALKNFHTQLPADATICLAIPAWQRPDGHFAHLPLSHDLSNLGYTRLELTHVRNDQLLYFRPDQVVARELLILQRTTR